jgi:hypothetical protein
MLCDLTIFVQRERTACPPRVGFKAGRMVSPLFSRREACAMPGVPGIKRAVQCYRGVKCFELVVFSCDVPGGRKEFHASP